MKKFLCLIILSLILLTGCVKKPEKTTLDKIKERDVLIVGVKDDSKPFGFRSVTTGNLEGFDIDLAREIAREILGEERKIKFVPVTPATRIEAVTSGEVDMVIATMSVTPQRQYLVDFSEPYYVAGQAAIVREDSNIHTFADLRKKTTIVVLASTTEQNLRRIIPTARLVGFKSDKAAFDAFVAGQGDALSTDDALLYGFLSDHKGYRMLKNRISQEPYAIAIRQYDDKKLKRLLDAVITRMKKDGTLKRFEEKWYLRRYNFKSNKDVNSKEDISVEDIEKSAEKVIEDMSKITENLEKNTSVKESAEKIKAEIPAVEKSLNEKTTTEKTATEKTVTEKTVTEKESVIDTKTVKKSENIQSKQENDIAEIIPTEKLINQ